MVNYVSLAAVAQRLIEANGRAVTLFRKNVDPQTVGEPWRGPDVPPADADGGAEVEAIACFVPHFGSALGRDLAELVGQSLTDIDQVCLLAADTVPGIDIETFDTMVDGDLSWNIDRVSRLQPGTVPLLWVLLLKAGGP